VLDQSIDLGVEAIEGAVKTWSICGLS
jgi:hypothetical protein